jgi:hypothetical protein
LSLSQSKQRQQKSRTQIHTDSHRFKGALMPMPELRK